MFRHSRQAVRGLVAAAQGRCIRQKFGPPVFARGIYGLPSAADENATEEKKTQPVAAAATAASSLYGGGGLYGATVEETKKNTHYDLLVIGGGSAGLSCVHEAATLNNNNNNNKDLKIGLIDYVQPSSQGSTWGLGGTCVNAGCIPKKLFHEAALLGEDIHELAPALGWEFDGQKATVLTHNWRTLRDNIAMYIKSINYGYRSRNVSDQVDYINAQGKLLDQNTVQLTTYNHNNNNSNNNKKSVDTVTASRIVLATGTRPAPTGVHVVDTIAITTDDLYSLDRAPGKTLILGAGFSGVETAGFLQAMHYDVTVVYRNKVLSSHDQQMAGMITQELQRNGVTMHAGYSVHTIDIVRPETHVDGPSYTVTLQSLPAGETTTTETETTETTETETETTITIYDVQTIVNTQGRRPLRNLGIDTLGLQTTATGHLVTDSLDCTNIDNIYALGDIAEGVPDLQPVASMSGKFLARRLFDPAVGKDNNKNSNNPAYVMQYENIASTVFAGIEYSSVGLTEEAAIEQYAHKGGIDVLHAHFTPLLWNLTDTKPKNACYVKIIYTNIEPQTVLGLHFYGPKAGEIMQGFSVAFNMKCTVTDITNTVGIHPTTAEDVVLATVTKSSGVDPAKTGC